MSQYIHWNFLILGILDACKMKNQNMQFWIFDWRKFKNKNMHFRIFDWHSQSNIPKYASQISQNAYFDFLVLENQNMPLGYLTGAGFSIIPKCIFWLHISICSLIHPKMRILINEFWKIRICILGYLTGAGLSNIPKSIFWFVEFCSVKNPKLQILICSLIFFDNPHKVLFLQT